MDKQIQKIQEKRKQKEIQEFRMLQELDSKKKKIEGGQRKFIHLKKDIVNMWTELEQNHDIDLIIKMEDDLKLKNSQVEDLISENKTKGRIVDSKNVIINDLNKYDENQGKIDQLANMIADAGMKYKKMRNTSL